MCSFFTSPSERESVATLPKELGNFFTSNQKTFAIYLRSFIVCINHEKVVSLLFEIFMSLFYYIHPEFW